MDEVGSAQAREHIELVERILAQSSRRLRVGGEYFVVWGLYSAGAILVMQLVADRLVPSIAFWALLPLMLAAVVFSALRGRAIARCKGRLTAVEREFFTVLWLAIGLAFLANVAGFRIFPEWGIAGLWTVATAIVLFFIGSHGNRRATLGGIIQVISLALANLDIAQAGYILAAGMLVGYAGFGLVELLAGE